MYRRIIAVTPILILTLSSCGKDSSVADGPYKAEIEMGLQAVSQYRMIPRGEIQIMSALSSQNEPEDIRNKRFHLDSLAGLDELKAKRLIDYAEIPQDGMMMMMTLGTRKFTVTPLPLSIQAADPKYSDNNLIFILQATCHVKTIVKDEKFSRPNLPRSDDFRLVVGTFEVTPTDFGGRYFNCKADTLKFRAVIKVDPISKGYAFLIADWGKIEEDGWQTKNVPN